MPEECSDGASLRRCVDVDSGCIEEGTLYASRGSARDEGLRAGAGTEEHVRSWRIASVVIRFDAMVSLSGI